MAMRFVSSLKTSLIWSTCFLAESVVQEEGDALKTQKQEREGLGKGGQQVGQMWALLAGQESR